jgi:hypothetical protein
MSEMPKTDGCHPGFIGNEQLMGMLLGCAEEEDE